MACGSRPRPQAGGGRRGGHGPRTPTSWHRSRLKSAGCDLVIMGTIIRDTIQAVATAKKLGWTDVTSSARLPPTIPSWRRARRRHGGLLRRHRHALRLSRHQLGRDQSLVRQVQGQDGGPNSAAQYGYVGADIVVKALEAAGKDLTRAKFLAALKSIKDYQTLLPRADAELRCQQTPGVQRHLSGPGQGRPLGGGGREPAVLRRSRVCHRGRTARAVRPVVSRTFLSTSTPRCARQPRGRGTTNPGAVVVVTWMPASAGMPSRCLPLGVGEYARRHNCPDSLGQDRIVSRRSSRVWCRGNSEGRAIMLSLLALRIGLSSSCLRRDRDRTATVVLEGEERCKNAVWEALAGLSALLILGASSSVFAASACTSWIHLEAGYKDTNLYDARAREECVRDIERQTQQAGYTSSGQRRHALLLVRR